MKNYKKGEVINSYFSRLSFGLGAYCIIFTMQKKYILVKIGEPMCPKQRWLIPATEENIAEIESLSEEFLSERGFEGRNMPERLATRFFKNGRWYKF